MTQLSLTKLYLSNAKNFESGLITKEEFKKIILEAIESADIDKFSHPSKMQNYTIIHFLACSPFPELIYIIQNHLSGRSAQSTEILKIIVNAKSSNGNTPLHMAVLNDSLKGIEILLKLGADTNILNMSGQRPIDMIHDAPNKENIQEIANLLCHFPKSYLFLYDIEQISKEINSSSEDIKIRELQNKLTDLIDKATLTEILYKGYKKNEGISCVLTRYNNQEAIKKASEREKFLKDDFYNTLSKFQIQAKPQNKSLQNSDCSIKLTENQSIAKTPEEKNINQTIISLNNQNKETFGLLTSNSSQLKQTKMGWLRRFATNILSPISIAIASSYFKIYSLAVTFVINFVDYFVNNRKLKASMFNTILEFSSYVGICMLFGAFGLSLGIGYIAACSAVTNIAVSVIERETSNLIESDKFRDMVSNSKTNSNLNARVN